MTAGGASPTFYIGAPLEVASDRDLARHLVDQLSSSAQPYLILANLTLGGRQIDCILAMEDRVWVFEAKATRLPVFGNENGDWSRKQADGTQLPYRNAYQQVLTARNIVRDAMASRRALGHWYPSAAVVFTTGLPDGSALNAGNFQAGVTSLADLRLDGDGRVAPWSLADWHAFAADHRLVAVSAKEAVAPPGLSEAFALLRATRSAVINDYGPGEPGWLAEGDAVRTDIETALGSGIGCFVSAPSGCGKSVLVRDLAARPARDGEMVLVLQAKLYDGSWGVLLTREAALLSSAPIGALLNAVRLCGAPVTIILDGLNEIADPTDALRGLRALARRYDARLVVTSQGPQPKALAGLVSIALDLPSSLLKQRIAEHGRGPLDRAALDALRAVRTGFEAAIIGEIRHHLTSAISRQQLIDLYARTRLGPAARRGSDALRRLAAMLQEQLSFSIDESGFDSFTLDLDLPDDIHDALFDAGLLVRRGGRVSFAHELLQHASAAHALAEAARRDPQTYAILLGTPRLAQLAGDILSVLSDRAACEAILAACANAQLLRDCADGQFGDLPRDVSTALLDAAFDAAIAEVDRLTLGIVEGERPSLDWVEASRHDWSFEERARLSACAIAMGRMRERSAMMAMCAAMDRRLLAERQRIWDAARAAGCRSVRSDSFRLAFHPFGTDDTGLSILLQRRHFIIDLGADGPLPPYDLTQLSSGQLYVYLEHDLSRREHDDPDAFAAQLTEIIETRFKTEPYLLQLVILHVAGFAGGASPPIHDRLVDALTRDARDDIVDRGAVHVDLPLDRAGSGLLDLAHADGGSGQFLKNAVAARSSHGVAGKRHRCRAIAGLRESGIGRTGGRLRADIADRRPVDDRLRDTDSRIGRGERADHTAAKVRQDRSRPCRDASAYAASSRRL